MADEISVASDLKQSIERSEWDGCGVRGFLIGRVWRGRVYVLNLWTSHSNKDESTTACMNKTNDLAACQYHLCAGSDVVGFVVVTMGSEVNDAEEHLSTLPPEVQAAVAGSLFVVCTIQRKFPSDPVVVKFHRYTVEDKVLHPLTDTPAAEDFDAEQVIFRLRARLPMQLQLDNSQPTDIEVWGEKMTKAFANIQTAVSSGGYTYGFRDTQMFLSENSVIGTTAKISTVQHLYDAIASDGENRGRKKNTTIRQAPVLVDLYQRVSGESEHFAHPTCAPAIHQRTGSFRFLQLTLPLDTVVEVDGREKLKVLQELFITSITTQLQAMQACVQQHQSKENEFYTPEPFHFSLPQRHTCLTVVYPRGISENKLENRRQRLHVKLCLGLDKPVFRRTNARVFPGQRAEGGYIVDPHVGLTSPRVSGGTLHLVQGHYSYHHYMQDRFDDDKWGCAYRSLQTIVSWFRFQGYTDKAIPSHKEIQQALVAVGDKEASFVGSRKWIGSFEVSYCLDYLLGVTSKFLNVSAGAELASKGRELAQHFDTVGTPIMIGGGVLAHTILGVDYSQTSGEIKFLILDPHYTGGEDLHTIQREGWCGWKGADFWNPTAHYNLCMPITPKCF